MKLCVKLLALIFSSDHGESQVKASLEMETCIERPTIGWQIDLQIDASKM